MHSIWCPGAPLARHNDAPSRISLVEPLLPDCAVVNYRTCQDAFWI